LFSIDGKSIRRMPGSAGSHQISVCQQSAQAWWRRAPDKNGDDFNLYVHDSKEHRNKTLADFRMMKLDGWGITMNQTNQLLRPWKEEVFVANVKSGDSIYESACGIGMNLLVTAEILGEHNITNIQVSGNDYVEESIAIANSIWDGADARRIARKGFFCRGDSTKLYWIESEIFDLVYTGYIDPIEDPLDLLPSNMTAEDKRATGAQMCKSSKKTHQKLAAQGQQVQNEWYNSWVKELIRIAKPGKMIVIENGAQSICTQTDDWGDVDKSWWKEAIGVYHWHVDPESLIIRDEPKIDGTWDATRYHVAFRKNE
jgi:SAM-dependent methyltransferase